MKFDIRRFVPVTQVTYAITNIQKLLDLPLWRLVAFTSFRWVLLLMGVRNVPSVCMHDRRQIVGVTGNLHSHGQAKYRISSDNNGGIIVSFEWTVYLES